MAQLLLELLSEEIPARMQAGAAREAVLFRFGDKPSMLTSMAAEGFVLIPDPAVIPLLPRHIHSLLTARGSIVLGGSHEVYLSANGNVAPQLFRCIAPLRTSGKLVGLVALGLFK